MWHVDEGGLNAYLDDALDTLPEREGERIRDHLVSCEACQRRLEEEREVRAEARSILDLASPDLTDLPTLDELGKRAAALAPRATRAGTRLWRVGWAASVVLAAAVGWMLGGRSRATPVTVTPETSHLSPGPSGADRVPRTEREEAGTGQPGVAFSGAQQPTPAARGGSPTRDEPVKQATSAAPPTAAGSAREDEGTGLAPVESGPSISLLALRSESLFAPVRLNTLGRSSLSTVAAGAATGSRRGATAQSVIIPVGSPGSVEGASSSLAGRRLLPPSAGATDVSDATMRRSTLPGLALTSAGRRAKAEVGGEREAPPGSLVIPGFRVLDVSWVRPGGAGGGVRVLQLLDTGDTLEVIQLPSGVSPPDTGDVRVDGRTQVVEPHNGGWLIARARLPRHALASLLLRLGGG